MCERATGASFLLEPAQAIGVGGVERGQELDGDLTAKARIARAVDAAHAALADQSLNPVRPDDAPGFEIWRCIG